MSRTLVFGGHSPIAAGLCTLLASHGGEVFLATRTPDEALHRQFATLSGVSVVTTDLRDPNSTVKTILALADGAHFSGVVFGHRSRGEATWQDQIQIDVITPQVIVDALCEAGLRPSSCVFLGSPAESAVLSDQDFVYHLAKSGSAALVRYLANSYGPIGVRVNAVSPDAYVAKPRSAEYWEQNERFRTAIEGHIPLQRFAEIDDIASAIAWLLSDQSKYVTGQTIRVDGGVTTVDRASIIRESARRAVAHD